MGRARAGQAEALGELCALYRNYLRMVVRAGLGSKLRERVELSDVVQEAPSLEAEVLWLYHVEGQSFVAIGVRLGVSRKVVRTIWARGLKSLRHRIDPP